VVKRRVASREGLSSIELVSQSLWFVNFIETFIDLMHAKVDEESFLSTTDENIWT
jgi:hypothetical protein